MILESIRARDQWVLHVEQGVWEAYDGTSKILDRFEHVTANTTKTWTNTVSGNCIGTPCDKVEHFITWGSTRTSYFLEQQSWASVLLCFENMMHITHAREQVDQIISKILKPATAAIQSNYARKRAAQFAQQQYIANRNFGQATNTFAYNWVVVGDEEIYIDTNANPANVFKLTPQMLQRRVDPLTRWGYFGENPYGDEMLPMIELVTDEQTLWDLDHLGGQQGIGGVPSIMGNWRFESFGEVSKYWRYDFSGKIGNYAVRVDPLNLRFNFVGVVAGLFRYQVVLPMKNIPSSGAATPMNPGTKDIPNPDFDAALYTWTLVWHRKAGMILVAESLPLNSAVTFDPQDFAGRWRFVTDNLGADINGQPIENKRREKGQFIADFKQAWKPMNNELSELYFHRREPACVIEISTCAADPGYPAQVYTSDPSGCDGVVIVD